MNVLHGARDNWYRPSDVCVAPDGSLFVADWYDPGVGGHNQQEVDKGRIFRLAPPGVKYTSPKVDLKTPEGAIEALKSPNLETRFLAFASCVDQGEAAGKAMHAAFDKSKDDPRYQARLAYCSAVMIAKKGKPEHLQGMVDAILAHENPDLRIVALRIAASRSSIW